MAFVDYQQVAFERQRKLGKKKKKPKSYVTRAVLEKKVIKEPDRCAYSCWRNRIRGLPSCKLTGSCRWHLMQNNLPWT